MPQDRQKILNVSVKRLLRRGASSRLRNIVNKTHGADLSILFRDLPLNDQRLLFDLIEDFQIEIRQVLIDLMDQVRLIVKCQTDFGEAHQCTREPEIAFQRDPHDHITARL